MKTRLVVLLQLRVQVMEDTSNPPTQPKRQKAQSLEDILLKLGPTTSVSYKPFQCEPRQTAKALLPSKTTPIRLFQLVFHPRPPSNDYYEYKSIREYTETTYSRGKGTRMDGSACGGVDGGEERRQRPEFKALREETRRLNKI